MPDIQEIRERKQEIEEKYGPWTTNVILAPGLGTSDRPDKSGGTRHRRFLQLVSDLAPKPLEELRILDLGCLEGSYSIEFALQGAEVVGIEGRENNIAKARFAQEILNLENVTFHQNDVRELSVETYGRFDIVLCLGILYHLEADSAFRLMDYVYEACNHLAVIDTHYSSQETLEVSHQGYTYTGHHFHEHDAGATPNERAGNVWASLDNPESFWFGFPSLCLYLNRVGFTSIYECHLPPWKTMPADRLTLIAIKGRDAQPRAIKFPAP